MKKRFIVLSQADADFCAYFSGDPESECLSLSQVETKAMGSPEYLIFEDYNDVAFAVKVILKCGWKNFRMEKTKIAGGDKELKFLKCYVLTE
ncbi:MAG: hypothetical protein IJ800_03440 [Clostridia bacterium]|nr:hypothetical protein [Clostridia bacterium]